MKIDNMQESSKHLVLSNFIIEAAVFDTKNWYNSEGFNCELSPKVANLKLNPSPSPTLGFHGYLLEGKLDLPNLWSAEQVSSSLSIANFGFASQTCSSLLLKKVMY